MILLLAYAMLMLMIEQHLISNGLLSPKNLMAIRIKTKL